MAVLLASDSWRKYLYFLRYKGNQGTVANTDTHCTGQWQTATFRTNLDPIYTTLFICFETICSIHTSINPDSDAHQHPDSNSVKFGGFDPF